MIDNPIFNLPFSRFIIYGNSMLPILKPGQEVLVFTWGYIFSKPRVGDVVVIKINGREMVKRIQKIDDRQIFVQGDNQKESTDSRDFGLVQFSDIIGKVIFVR